MVKQISVLLLLFGLSVLVRLPNLNRPLSKHHEFCTAVALRVLDIWHEESASKYNYLPLTNYPGEANKHINNFASASGELVDENGNYYYVSHPPFAYYLPHAVFSVLNIKPSVAAIQWFNIAVQLICLIGLVGILLLYSTNQSGVILVIAGITAYLFNPATLWFQSNTYMSDMLVQLPFIWAIYFALSYNKTHKKLALFWLFVTVFFMIYTSWLGYFFALVLGLWFLFKRQLLNGLILSIFVIAATALFVYQYSSINGFEAYYNEMSCRFFQRSFSGNYFGSMLPVFKNYITSFGLIIVIVLAVVLWLRKSINWSAIKFFTWISLVPIIILHLVLSNYSGHDFTTLYASVFLSVFVAILIEKVWQNKSKFLAIGLMLILSIGGIASYYFINRPGEISYNGDYYATHKKRGEFIKENSKASEVVFIKNLKPNPQLIYYAHRNMVKINTYNEAQIFLEDHSIDAGIIFELDGDSIKIDRRFYLE